MNSNLNKSELPDNLVSEQSQYEFIKLLGNSRSQTGNSSWTANSSGSTYPSTTGQLGVMQQLAEVLYPYHITAEDWNTLCNTVFNAANPTLYYPKLNSPWVQMNGNEPVYYYKDLTGRVYLAGMITSNNTGTHQNSVIFTLPAGFRIKQVETFVVEAAETNDVFAAQIYAFPNGNITMGVGNKSQWISLSTVSFLAYN